MPRFAAIDVGSNALRLRIVEADGSSRAPTAQLALLHEPISAWRDVVSVRAPVRLGGEVFQTGRLTPASIGQAAAALKEFRRQMDEAKIASYRATATSAVREAQNGSTLVERARREAGIDLEVIEGVEEARLIQLAVGRRVPIGDQRVLLIDVGGGSTELTALDHGESTFSISLPVGAVRLIEAYLRGASTIDRERTGLIREAIDRALVEARPHLARATFDALIGTGGNVETLAELCPLAPSGREPRAHVPTVDVAAAKVLFAKMSAMSTAERARAFGLRMDRADTLVPATAIFLRLAELFGVRSILSPGVGLKDGILEELVDRYFQVWDAAREAEGVLAACGRVGARYGFDASHGALVMHLATRLFDDIQREHGLGERDRLLLRAAALLHDIGDFVRYDGHHKHSHYLILHADIMGLTPDERAIVANVARYHRKSVPDPSHPNFRDLDKEGRAKVRALAAILRIADALDREHLGKVKDVRADVDAPRGRLLLAVVGDEDRELEEWTVRAKSGLLKDVFGLEVELIPRSSSRPVG